ncbi:unnamed protein product [Spirodela intermedia]|uniref:Uncharacterized protein n=1 Tax=Spirodela intermedia TaxID=51605 RepID=A0A7I8J0S0_SPIIN|nr:unnamed protein product [Spirodela intermedia]CAA6663816.1 unnamed protein product [Spirodela intermedia]
MSSQTVPRTRRSGLFSLRRPSAVKKLAPSDSGVGVDNGTSTKPSSPDHPVANGGERTVKKLRLSKAVTIPEATKVSDACRRMATAGWMPCFSRMQLACSLGLLRIRFSFLLVHEFDIAIRVIAEGLRPEQTVASRIMTRNPIFVSSGTLAIEALQKMIQGKFRHLPVVENGEVIALLDITKCLYDAISRMEKAAEQGSAIAAAVEGVERQWGSDFSAQYAFIETLRERMFKPSLSTIISESPKAAIVSLSDPVYVAAKRMRDLRASSVIIASGASLREFSPQTFTIFLYIFSSKDILMRVVAQRLSPELTLVEKVMTANPECATVDTTILDALHMLHDGKFLHIPVLDKEGSVVACVDVLQLTHAAISSVSGDGAINGAADTMMHKFWDSVLTLDPPDNVSETNSEASGFMASEGPAYPSLALGSSFAFKFEDNKGRVHRFNCGSEHLGELVSAIAQRTGVDFCQDAPQLLYEDDEGDRVLLSTDADLRGAVNHARISGWKGVLAGVILLTGIAVTVVYLRRSKR